MKFLSKISMLFYCIFLLSSVTISQNNASATIQLDKTEIKIGEQIITVLKLSYPVTDSYDFVLLKDTLSKEIEIVEMGGIDTSFEGSNLSIRTLTRTIILTSFDTGYHVIPPIIFPGKKDSVKTEPFLISVLGVDVIMPNQTAQEKTEIDIKDIKQIREANFSIWEWVKMNALWITLFFVLIAAVLAYFKFLHPKLKDKGVTTLIQKRIIPPYDLAIEKLHALENQKLWQNGNVKSYHVGLSDIVREYIEDQMSVPAMESTTIEITEALRSNGISKEIVNELKNTLELSDLVKFAKYLPVGAENDKSMKMAYHFIDITKPRAIIIETNTEEVKNV